MRQTLSSWEILAVILTSFTLMSSAKEKATENNNSISGLTQLQIFTPIPSFGILSALCKLFFCLFIFSLVMLRDPIFFTIFELAYCDWSNIIHHFCYIKNVVSRLVIFKYISFFFLFLGYLHSVHRLTSLTVTQILCGWHSHQRVQELRVNWGSISKEPANEDILKSLEC